MEEKPNPLTRVEKRLCGKGPACHVEHSLFIVVTLDCDVSALAYPLDLAEGRLQLENAQKLCRVARETTGSK